MKTINLVSDLNLFHKFFGEMLEGQHTVVIWQLDPMTQKRTIFHSLISQLNPKEQSLSFNTIDDRPYDFAPEAVYFYIESRMCIFKAEQEATQNNYLSIKYPDELKMLDDMEDDKLKAVFSAINPDYVKVPPTYHEITHSKDKGYTFVAGESIKKATPDWQKVQGGGRKEKIETMWKGALQAHDTVSDHDKDLFEEELSFVTLDEEDKLYEGKREAPRARPPEGKMALIQVVDESRPAQMLPLFDLSRGGLGFLVFKEDEFEKGQVLQVQGFDTKKFDNPMFVIIRSVREADEMRIQFKVGCQFISAEEALKAS